MKSKIIKVSIILIFMMFSAGLFNFCFAFTEGVDYTILDTYSFSSISSTTVIVNTIDTNVSFKRINELSDTEIEDLGLSDEIDTIENNLLYVFNNTGKLYCFKKNSEDFRFVFSSESLSIRALDSTGSRTSITSFIYDFDTQTWTKDKSSTGQTVTGGYIFNIVNISKAPIYYRSNESYYGNVIYEPPVLEPSIKMEVNQTGTKTGNVTFTPENWDSHMYYIKDDMDELTRLIAEEELSVMHDKVKLYSGPIAIEYGEYVMGMLFDETGTMIFSEISDSVTIDHDSILDDTHKLYLDKENENIYYLSIHGYQTGDYVRVSNIPIGSNLYDEKDTIILNNYSSEYNGLTIGYLYETALHHMNRKVTVNKNGITYFYLYDSNNTLINTVVLNSSNYYSGEEYDFDVELNYGNCFSEEGVLGVVPQEICTWVKVKPIINVPSIDNYELYFRIKDYGNIGYIQEEYRNIGLYHDNQMKKVIGFDTKNSPTHYVRIDDLIYDYFYIATNQNGTTTFTFSLELRSKSGQVIETKEFTVNLSEWNKEQGTVSSTTNGKDDTYIRNPNELSGNTSGSNKFDFSGLNDLTEQDLKTNVEGLIDSSIGFFSLFSTIFLLLPTWISSLLYLFFFGIIIITLLRFIRGS